MKELTTINWAFYDIDPTISSLSPCPSLPSFATDDRKQPECLTMVLINKNGPLCGGLCLEFNLRKKKFYLWKTGE